MCCCGESAIPACPRLVSAMVRAADGRSLRHLTDCKNANIISAMSTTDLTPNAVERWARDCGLSIDSICSAAGVNRSTFQRAKQRNGFATFRVRDAFLRVMREGLSQTDAAE